MGADDARPDRLSGAGANSSTLGVTNMKLRAIAGTVLALSCLAAAGALAEYPTKPGSNPNTITISCYRGPTTDVIWDRPNTVFVDDLVKVGYTYPQAYAIAETVCRDEYGVHQPEYQKTSLREIMAKTPPSRRKR